MVSRAEANAVGETIRHHVIALSASPYAEVSFQPQNPQVLHLPKLGFQNGTSSQLDAGPAREQNGIRRQCVDDKQPCGSRAPRGAPFASKRVGGAWAHQSAHALHK